MPTGQSDPRSPMQPMPTTTPRRATYPTSGYPRARAVIWTAALIAGGGALIVTFFVAIGVIDLVQFPFLGLIALALALFFGITMYAFNRSERRGNSRWADRERRGF